MIYVISKGKEVNRMKKYVTPKITYTDLRADERVCTCSYEEGACTGQGTSEVIGWWVGLNS